MNLNEWNARLHGLVIFRALLDDDVIAKLVDLTDRMVQPPGAQGQYAVLQPPLNLPSSSTPPTSANISPPPSLRPKRSASGRQR